MHFISLADVICVCVYVCWPRSKKILKTTTETIFFFALMFVCVYCYNFGTENINLCTFFSSLYKYAKRDNGTDYMGSKPLKQNHISNFDGFATHNHLSVCKRSIFRWLLCFNGAFTWDRWMCHVICVNRSIVSWHHFRCGEYVCVVGFFPLLKLNQLNRLVRIFFIWFQTLWI